MVFGPPETLFNVVAGTQEDIGGDVCIDDLDVITASLLALVIVAGE